MGSTGQAPKRLNKVPAGQKNIGKKIPDVQTRKLPTPAEAKLRMSSIMTRKVARTVAMKVSTKKR